MIPPNGRQCSAVSLVTNYAGPLTLAGDLLVVWNRRYWGWTLPGGMVEDGETIEAAQARELLEETRLATRSAKLIYGAPIAGPVVEAHRAAHVYVFRVDARGRPQAGEDGCPVQWLTGREFVDVCPFRAFYAELFRQLAVR